MKKKDKVEIKQYVLITIEKEKILLQYRNPYRPLYLPDDKEILNYSEKLFFMNEDEIIDYVKNYGSNNIKCILKNEPLELETIINIKERRNK